jgi:hypothetical protein
VQANTDRYAGLAPFHQRRVGKLHAHAKRYLATGRANALDSKVTERH